MPLLDEIFPKKLAEAKHLKELYPNTGVLLTFDRIEEREDQDGNAYQVAYFRELLKPLALNKTNAEMIAHVAGSDNTDYWEGVQVHVYAVDVEVRDGKGPPVWRTVFRIGDKVPRDLPRLNNKSDLVVLVGVFRQEQKRLQAANSAKLLGSAASTGIGIDRAIKMMYLLKQRGKDWQFVVDHFTNSLKMGEQIAGIAKPPDLPDSMAALIGGIVKSFPITTQVDAAEHEAECRALWTPSIKGEVIDPKTGEVIDMTDIPF